MKIQCELRVPCHKIEADLQDFSKTRHEPFVTQTDRPLENSWNQVWESRKRVLGVSSNIAQASKDEPRREGQSRLQQSFTYD